jgi:hypothetical protein
LSTFGFLVANILFKYDRCTGFGGIAMDESRWAAGLHDLTIILAYRLVQKFLRSRFSDEL